MKNKSYIVYDTDTGEILRRVNCSLSMKPKHLEAGTALIEGDASDRTHKIRRGKVGKKTDKQMEAQRLKEDPPTEPVPYEIETHRLSNGEYDDIMSRLADLEDKS